jgi:hypothetical protein
MLKVKKITAIIAGTVMTVGAFAADGDLKISTAFDMNYTYSTNKDQGVNNYTIPNHLNNNSHNDFDIVMAEVALSGAYKTLDYFVSFNAAAVNGGGSNAISEAYLTHNFSDMFSLTAGRFYSNLGFESYRAKDNWNYSKSIGWQATPYWHEGAALNFNMGNGFGAALFVYDQVDSDSETNGHKAYSAQLSYSNDSLSAVYNYYTASKDRKDMNNDGTPDNGIVLGEGYNIHDLNLQYAINKEFSLAGAFYMATTEEGVTASDDLEWNSYAVYAKYMVNERFDLALRYEMFTIDNEGLAIAGLSSTTDDNEIQSITLTAGYDLLNNSKLKLEVRMDSSDEKIWADDDGKAADDNTTVAAAWLFNI